MKNKIKELDNGQSIWEVVVALGIVALVALGLVKVLTLSIKSSRFSADQSKITALAQKKFAEIVDYKNKNSSFWTIPIGTVGTNFNGQEYNPYETSEGYCIKTTVSDFSTELPDTTPNYADAKMAKITVVVFWNEKADAEGSQCLGKNFEHSTSFDTYVTN